MSEKSLQVPRKVNQYTSVVDIAHLQNLTLETLVSKFKFSFVIPMHFHRSSGETLLKYQLDSCCVIMSLILMTALFYNALILQGEI